MGMSKRIVTSEHLGEESPKEEQPLNTLEGAFKKCEDPKHSLKKGPRKAQPPNTLKRGFKTGIPPNTLERGFKTGIPPNNLEWESKKHTAHK